jgi:hypothetical protein
MILKVRRWNIRIMYWLLKRFLCNTKYGIIRYHNFNCYWDTVIPYNNKFIWDTNPDIVELSYWTRPNNEKDIPYIKIRYQENVSGMEVQLGDRIKFQKNRIIVEVKSTYDILYQVFLHRKLSKKDREYIIDRRLSEAKLSHNLETGVL